MNLSVVILAFDSERTIGDTIRSAALVSSDIHVVDSFSHDATCDIARELGASVVQHAFVNYAAQRNWAIENLALRHQWELHLDSDERLSQELVAELQQDSWHKGIFAGYYAARLVHFLGRPIRHGGMFPIWHLRLFRRGLGRCETREYDQHFLVDGPTAKLRGWLIDDNRSPLHEWVNRHNQWSDAEVRELQSDPTGRPLVQPRLFGNPLERKRSLRQNYQRLPGFVRVFLLFGYRYFLRLGFLDGKEGLTFFVLQTLWYRFLVDAKLFEQELAARGSPQNAVCQPRPECGARRSEPSR